MAGMDVIANSIHKMIHVMKRPDYQRVLIHLKPQFHELFTCFKNVSNTNTFMVMTINRCIDYTKVSKGIKLTPKYDTVEVMDVLAMPLQCMKNIQNRIKIELLPLSPEICSHIITDKQWLQENLLCLLSNAVKYSSEGTVSISVSITHHTPVLPPQEAPKPPKLVYTAPTKDSASTTDRMTKNDSNSISIQMLANSYYSAFNSLHSPENSHNHSIGGLHSPNISAYFAPNVSSSPPIRRKKEIKVVPIDQETSHRLDISSNSEEIVGRESRRPSNSSGPFTVPPFVEGNPHQSAETASTRPRASITRAESAKNIVKPYIRIEVSDTGIGINEDAMKNLFSPFQRAQRMAGGTGNFIL
jgi:signal transduction histidine kinase